MLNTPGIAVLSSSSTKPKSLIQYLLKKVPKASEKHQTWTIDTKYYTAEVQFLDVDIKNFDLNVKSVNIEAIIIHFDANIESGLEDLKQFLVLDELFSPEIKLLLANYCNDTTKVTRSQVMEWCLKNGFEFIELFPNISTAEDRDEDTEKHGFERILEALEANLWSNMVKKQKDDQNKEKMDPEEQENDDFCNMFGQLLAMKSSITSLPSNERKQCAEQVVTAFWKAIGGDESEISDPSS